LLGSALPIPGGGLDSRARPAYHPARFKLPLEVVNGRALRGPSPPVSEGSLTGAICVVSVLG